MRRAGLLHALLGLVVLAYAQPSAAADSKRGAALNWVRLPGAEQCMTAGELAERVEQRLGRKLFVLDSDAAISVDGHVAARNGGGFAARIALVDRARHVLGERTIENRDRDCRQLNDALVLVLALTLMPSSQPGTGIALAPATEQLLRSLFQTEPTEVEATPELEREPEAERELERKPERDRDPEPKLVGEPQPSAAPASFAAGAAMLLSMGYLPGATFGIQLNVMLTLPSLWPLRLAASLLPSHERRVAAVSTDFSLRQLSLMTCPWQLGELLQLQACVGLAAAQLQTRSRGYAIGGAARSDAMLDATSMIGARWQVLHHLVAQLAFTAALPFIQRTYDYQALDGQPRRLFRTAQVCGQVAIGVGGIF